MNLKCKIGWHDWDYESKQDDILIEYTRRCKRCGKVDHVHTAIGLVADPYVTKREFDEFKKEIIQRLEKLEGR